MKNFITILLAILITSCDPEDGMVFTDNSNNPVVIITPPVVIDYTLPPTQAELNALPGWTNTPDPAFEQVLIDRGFDDVLDGRVLTSKISTITGLERPDGTRQSEYGRMFEHKNIQNTTGIENFIGLQFISFWDNPITSIDLSNLKRLKILGLSECPLESLDISNNQELIELAIQGNSDRISDPTYPYGKTLGLTSINFSNNLKLERFYASCNRLEYLDVTMLPKLTDLWLGSSDDAPTGGNYIKTLDLTQNPWLTTLIAKGGAYEYIDTRGAGRYSPETITRNVNIKNNAALRNVKVSNLAYLNQVNRYTNPNATGYVIWKYDSTTSLSE